MSLNEEIRRECEREAEQSYQIFNDKLSKSGYPSYGVRIPVLRKLAKRLYPTVSFEEIDSYRPDCFEGVIVKGLLIGQMTDFAAFTKAWDGLLPAFDSWAETDTTTASLKILKREKEAVLDYYLPLKDHNGEFEKRFLVLLTMDYFLDAEHIDRVLTLWEEIPSGQYYVDMALAWGLATAAAKFFDKTYFTIQNGGFSHFVTNKAIQKARESYRLSDTQKSALTALRK